MNNENTPTIVTKNLILRKFEQLDAKALFELLSDTDVNTYLPWLTHKNIGETIEFMQKRFFDYYTKDRAYRYAICLKEYNIPIGYIWLSDDDSNDFGYGLKKEFWHKGITTEAATAVLARIESAGYDYITATHDVNNHHSGKVMANLGMSYQYSYVEQWQPKNITVTFRLYQLSFNNLTSTYMKYWDMYDNHFIEKFL